MRPEEMRAALVRAMIDAIQRDRRAWSFKPDTAIYTDDHAARAALDAIESVLSEIGAKITVREPSEAMVEAAGRQRFRAYTGGENVAELRLRCELEAAHDAAPLTPWHTEDTPDGR